MKALRRTLSIGLLILCSQLVASCNDRRNATGPLLGVELKNGSNEPWHFTEENSPRKIYNYYLKDGKTVLHGPCYTFRNGEVTYHLYKHGKIIESNSWIMTGHDIDDFQKLRGESRASDSL